MTGLCDEPSTELNRAWLEEQDAVARRNELTRAAREGADASMAMLSSVMLFVGGVITSCAVIWFRTPLWRLLNAVPWQIWPALAVGIVASMWLRPRS